jgi:GLPGLI family protein
MKKLLLILIALSWVSISKAQYVGRSEIPLNKFTVLDSAQLKFTYNFSYKKSYFKKESDTAFVVDKQSLLIGKKISKYYSQYYLDYCERMKNKIYDREYEEGMCSFEIFKNYPVNKVTATEQAGQFAFGGNYIYNENTPEFKWAIDKDTMTLLGYTCQKATTTFRGRNYTAWFATDIPSNNGPWKFGGLPGLILKISDDKRNFIFECIGIQKLEKHESIKLYTLNYTKVTRVELDKLYRRYFKDPIQFWIDVRSEMRGQIDAKDIPKLNYNPIELE